VLGPQEAERNDVEKSSHSIDLPLEGCPPKEYENLDRSKELYDAEKAIHCTLELDPSN
jgi:hypothetical protein